MVRVAYSASTTGTLTADHQPTAAPVLDQGGHVAAGAGLGDPIPPGDRDDGLRDTTVNQGSEDGGTGRVEVEDRTAPPVDQG